MNLASYESANEKLCISVMVTNDTAIISLKGVFSVHARHQFKSSYLFVMNKAGIKNIVVNLASVTFMDSSALGMLLELRQSAGVFNRIVFLSNPIEHVNKMLNIACFHKLFSIVKDVSPVQQNVPAHSFSVHCEG